MNSYHLSDCHHRQEETRTLIRDSLSLSLCVHSLLSSCSLVVVCFHFSPTKGGVRYKNKNSLPSPLSRMDESMLSSSAQNQSYNCVIKGLHEYFISTICFVCHHRRALSLLRPYERERERKRRRKRRARKNDGRKFCIYKIRETWKKTSRCCSFSDATREREIGSGTRCIITQFCQISWYLSVIIA